jgi:hypothetical protein
MAVRTGDPMLWGIVGATVPTSGLRIVGVLAFGRRSPGELAIIQARRWENRYAADTLAFTLVIAVFGHPRFHVGIPTATF